MSKRWLVILLLISAAFNLAVMGSFIYLRSIRPPFSPGFPKELGEKGHWRGKGPGGHGPMFMFTDSTRALHEEFKDTKQELMLELAKDPIDTAKIEAIIKRSLSSQAALERDLADRLIRLRKSMSPEEAKEHFTLRAREIDERGFDRPFNKHKRRKH